MSAYGIAQTGLVVAVFGGRSRGRAVAWHLHRLGIEDGCVFVFDNSCNLDSGHVLLDRGVPIDRAMDFTVASHFGKSIVLVNGTRMDLAASRSVFLAHGAELVEEYGQLLATNH